MSTRARGRSCFLLEGAASHFLKQIRQIGVDPTREFHVAIVPRRVWCCDCGECHCRHRDRNHNKTRPEWLLAHMAKEDTRLTGLPTSGDRRVIDHNTASEQPSQG